MVWFTWEGIGVPTCGCICERQVVGARPTRDHLYLAKATNQVASRQGIGVEVDGGNPISIRVDDLLGSAGAARRESRSSGCHQEGHCCIRNWVTVLIAHHNRER